MTQEERIMKMEEIFDRSQEIKDRMKEIFVEFKKNHEGVKKLEEYYHSKEWREDEEASNTGKLPEGLKCGILSQDGIYNFLDDYNVLLDELLEAVRGMSGKYE